MAAGPPDSISSRMGLREGSSFMRATRASSCSFWAGLVRPPRTEDMAGSCISALPSRSAMATNCGFCISCCIVDTYFCGSSAAATSCGDRAVADDAGAGATVFCSCSAISLNDGSLAICSAISLMLGSYSARHATKFRIQVSSVKSKQINNRFKFAYINLPKKSHTI
uniref:Uncharacterized protein n=1 Tax=Aegilops tauschii subsp. strangulata TaxID=200361 RepID=A0A453MJE9_AEGTS